MFNNVLDLHKSFWHHKPAPRPLFGCNIGMFSNEHCPLTMGAMPRGIIEPDDIDIGLFLRDCENLYVAHNELNDDYPFAASPFVYIPWMEAIMGCAIMASDTSMWANPCVADWNTWEWKDVGTENLWTAKLFEILEALIKHAAGRFPVAATMMRGPSDIYAAMRGAARFPLDFYDHPDSTREALRKCADVFIKLGKEQLALIPESNEGFMDGDRGTRVWAPDKVLWLQEDAMALLSPEIYRDFILPEDRRIGTEFSCVALHLHNSALWALDDIVAVREIDAIELNLDGENSDAEETLTGWKKIIAHKPLIVWRAFGQDFRNWLDRMLDELPASGLSIQVTARSLDEAKMAKEQFLQAVEANFK